MVRHRVAMDAVRLLMLGVATRVVTAAVTAVVGVWLFERGDELRRT